MKSDVSRALFKGLCLGLTVRIDVKKSQRTVATLNSSEYLSSKICFQNFSSSAQNGARRLMLEEFYLLRFVTNNEGPLGQRNRMTR